MYSSYSNSLGYSGIRLVQLMKKGPDQRAKRGRGRGKFNMSHNLVHDHEFQCRYKNKEGDLVGDPV
jgi:hypothetical protein